MSNHLMHKEQLANQFANRPTVGWLSTAMGVLDEQGWLGAFDEAGEQGVNLICFVGEPLPDQQHAPLPMAFELARHEHLDGVVFWSSAIGLRVGPKGVADFTRLYAGQPMVSLQTPLENIPSVLLDDYSGMRLALDHLIEVHGCQRLVFICGPGTHVGAQERYRAYLESLKEHGLAFDPRLVSPPSDGWRHNHAGLVRLLLDERGLRPGLDFDGVVGANEGFALGLMAAMRERGVAVTENIGWVGFDDTVRGQTSSPPLTTVRPDHYKMGREAIRLIVAQLRGEVVPDQVQVPSRLIVRQSCGCLPQAVIQAAATALPGSQARAGGAAVRRQEAVSAMVQAAQGLMLAAGVESMERLFDALLADLDRSANTFLPVLNAVLQDSVESRRDVREWQGVISAMRSAVLPGLSAQVMVAAENLWGQARVMIAENTLRAEMRRGGLATQQVDLMLQTGLRLMSVLDVRGLMDALADSLPPLNISGCYLALYEDAQRSLDAARLFLALRQGERLALPLDGQLFGLKQLIPDDLFPREERFSWVVEPLYFGQDQLGYIVFETWLREASVYDRLRGEISGALRSALLIQERNRALSEAQVRVREMEILQRMSAAVSGSLYLDFVLDAAAHVLAADMGFTYVAINLIDRAANRLQTPRALGRAANLQGLSRLLDQVQDDILMDVARGQAVQVVAGWDDRFDRQIFEQSGHADLVRAYVPLVSRQETVGVLEAGYDRHEHATIPPEQLGLLRGIADQIALAIENARLLEQIRMTAAGQKELTDLAARMQQAADIESLMHHTAQELSRLLGASRVYVRMGAPESWAK